MSGAGYDAVAAFYDLLAAAYSLGRIPACKRAQVAGLGPGQRVLFAGAGTGGEALLAARAGARVTVLDLSGAMLARARARFRAAGLALEAVQGDILDHARPGGYDAVVAQFFLNVFPEPAMREVLAHLARLVAPGGRLLLADFAPAEGPPLIRAARRAYFALAVAFFRAAAGNPLHALYAYANLLPGTGLVLESAQTSSRGPISFQTLSAINVDQCPQPQPSSPPQQEPVASSPAHSHSPPQQPPSGSGPPVR